MLSGVDLFRELLYPIAHIQALLAIDLVSQSLSEINNVIHNIQSIETTTTDMKEKVLSQLLDAREFLTQGNGSLKAAEKVWEAYLALRNRLTH